MAVSFLACQSAKPWRQPVDGQQERSSWKRERSQQMVDIALHRNRGALMPVWLENFFPILILLAVVSVVIVRLPRIELGHSLSFRRRRVMNWLPLGLLYAFLYMGRYNLNVAKRAFGTVMDNEAFAIIFGVGTLVYGVSFIINGPLTDRIGGRKAILIGGAGAAVMNIIMGVVTYLEYTHHIITVFSVLYAGNMYFQSFGAVAIVKVNAPWFHVQERGVFGAIFGILISLGIYFAYDWGGAIANAFPTEWVFFVPAAILTLLGLVVAAVVRDSPAEAGLKNFDTADASSGDDGPRLSSRAVFKLMLANGVIMTIAFIEFCSGFIRQAIMQWYPIFTKQTAAVKPFVSEHWGILLCAAGILGGVVAGIISDRVFNARRGPVAALLYGVLLLGAIVMTFVYKTDLLGPLAILMSMAVIGVHGMLSGTASMDFGGTKNVGTAVGIIDGFVYAGTGVMSLTFAVILPTGDAAKVVDNYWAWPVAMIPVALIGLYLATRIWNAKPKGKAAAH